MRLPLRFFSVSQDAKTLSFGDLTRKYGSVALGVYLSLAGVVFCGCFSAVSVLGITGQDIQRYLNKAKQTVGIKVDETKETSAIEDFFKRMNIKDPRLAQFTTNVVLSLAMTKLFSPFKIVATAFITPPVAKRLQAMGYKFGKRAQS